VKAVCLFDVLFDECVYWITGGLGVICGARDVYVNEGGEGGDFSTGSGVRMPPHHRCVWWFLGVCHVSVFLFLYSFARFWYEWVPFGVFLGVLSVFCGVFLCVAYNPPSPLRWLSCCVDA